MITEFDAHSAATAIIRQYGEDAPIHAAMRADAMLESGDLEGSAASKRLLRVVDDIQRKTPKVGRGGSLSGGVPSCGGTPHLNSEPVSVLLPVPRVVTPTVRNPRAWRRRPCTFTGGQGKQDDR